MIQFPSYWEREEWLNPPDLLIVGGGIVGASIALFYKNKYPGHNVVITDKGFTPEGASTRNAGFACIGSVSEHLADIQISGEDTVLKRIERRWTGLQLLRETLGEHALEYRNTGGFEIFTDHEKFIQCRENIGLMNELLKRQMGIEGIYSEKTYCGYPAIFNRVEGAVNSGRMMRILHDILAKAGVRTWWNSEVKSVKSNRVVFNDGFEMHADKIVLAVNGFIPRLAKLPVKPARGYVFVTKPIPNLPWTGTFHYDEGYVYFRNIGNRLLLGGGRNIAKEEETTDVFGINPAVKKYLIHFADHVLNLPKDWVIDIEWSGIMGMTGNKEPIIKQLEPELWAAVGLSGMGVAIGMQVAKEVVDSLEF